MSTPDSRRIQQLRRRVIRLERELAALKAAPPVQSMVYCNQCCQSYPPGVQHLHLFSYGANTTQPVTVTLDGSSGYSSFIDPTVTVTNANPIITYNIND